MEEIKIASISELLLASKMQQRKVVSEKIKASMVYSVSWRATLSDSVDWSVHNLSEMRRLAYYLIMKLDLKKGFDTPIIDRDDIVSECLLNAVRSYNRRLTPKELTRCLSKAYYAYYSYRLKTIQPLEPTFIDGDIEFDLVEGLEGETDLDSIPSPHSFHTLKEVESMYCVTLDTEDKILDLLEQIEQEGE